MEASLPTLCFPDGEKTCFACCPPIRPAGYEHNQYRGMVRRALRENTRDYRPEQSDVRPIRGFSCWALGYLDPSCRLAGCLLHPARNQGRDLRFRVDYGDKCRRETCPEAAIFDRLEPSARRYWLCLADGLDSFSYSSRRENPLFHLLNWGPGILHMIAEEDRLITRSWRTLKEAFPLLAAPLSPRGWAYPVKRLAARRGAGLFRNPGTARGLEEALSPLIARHGPARESGDAPVAPHTHRLPLDRSFLDFLRLTVGLRRIPLPEARALQALVDDTLDQMGRGPDETGTPG